MGLEIVLWGVGVVLLAGSKACRRWRQGRLLGKDQGLEVAAIGVMTRLADWGVQGWIC